LLIPGREAAHGVVQLGWRLLASPFRWCNRGSGRQLLLSDEGVVLLRSESLLLLLLLLQRRRSRDRARPHWIVSVQGLQKVGQEAPAGVVFAPDVVPGCDCGWARARWPPAASPPPPPLFLLVPRLLRRLADLPLLPPTPPPWEQEPDWWGRGDGDEGEPRRERSGR